MENKIKPKILTEKEYRQQKANVNLYERTWRKSHPAEHKKKSKALLSAILESAKK